MVIWLMNLLIVLTFSQASSITFGDSTDGSTTEADRAISCFPNMPTQIALLSTLTNSTLAIEQVCIQGGIISPTATIDTNSGLFLTDCLVMLPDGAKSPFDSNYGELSLNNVSLTTATLCRTITPSIIRWIPSPSHRGVFGQAIIAHCTFTSFIISSDTPFIPAARNGNVVIFSCEMSNVTSTSSHHDPDSQHHPPGHSIIASSRFERVDSVFDGGIVGSINTDNTLTCINTTFHHMQRTHSPSNAGNKSMERQENPVLPITFEDDEFHSCRTDSTSGASTEKRSGGAIFVADQRQGDLTLTRCTFDDCYAYTHGGSVFIARSLGIIATNCTFENCQADQDSGGIYCQNVTGCAIVSGTNFTDCLSQYSGAGLQIRYFTISTLSFPSESGGGESASVFDCRMVRCWVRTRIGGGLSFKPSTATKAVARNVLFWECSAPFMGGGVSLEAALQDLPDAVYLYYCAFWGCCATRTGTTFGQDVYFEDFSDIHTVSPLYMCYTTNNAKDRVGRYVSSSKCEYKPEWIGDDQPVYAKSTGTDLPTCGLTQSDPCKTMESALDALQKKFWWTVHVMDTTLKPQSVVVSDKAMVLDGMGKSQSILSTVNVGAQDSLLTVGSTTCRVSTVKIVMEGGIVDAGIVKTTHSESRLEMNEVAVVGDVSVKREVSALSLTFGTSTLINCEMSSITILDVPAVSVGASVSISDSTFTDIKREQGNGTVFDCDIATQASLSLDGVSFLRCSCSAGCGGAVHVVVHEGGSFALNTQHTGSIGECTVASAAQSKCRGGGLFVRWADTVAKSVSIGNTTFLAGNQAWKGKNCYIEAPSIDAVATKAILGFTVSADRGDWEKCMGNNGSDTDYIVPLSFYVNAFQGRGFVGVENGLDFTQCGYEGYPCTSVSYLTARRFASKKREIAVEDGYVWHEVLTLGTQDWDIEGAQTPAGVAFTAETPALVRGMLTLTRALSVRSINFLMPQTLGRFGETLLHCDTVGNTVTLSDCRVSWTGGSNAAVEVSFILMEGGSLTATKLQVEDVALLDHSLIVVNGKTRAASVLLADCTFTGVTGGMGCAVETLDSRSVNATNSRFDGSSRSTGDGGGLSIKGETVPTKAVEILVDRCTFISCSATAQGAKGAGLWIQAREAYVVDVKGTSFSGCVAAEGTVEGHGIGGGLCVELVELLPATSLTVSDVTFGTEGVNSAWVGRDMFLTSPDLFATCSSTSLPFVEAMTSQGVETVEGFHAGDTTHAIPLLYFIISLENSVFVSSDSGEDVVVCGFTEYPCKTLTTGLTRQEAIRGSTVTLSNNHQICEAVTITTQIGRTVTGVAERASVDVAGADSSNSGLICVSGDGQNELSITLIDFLLGASVANHNTFISKEAAGPLSLDSCSFKNKSGDIVLSYTLLRATCGSVSMSEVRVEGLQTSAAGVVVVGGTIASLDISNTVFSATECVDGTSLIVAQGSAVEISMSSASADAKGGSVVCGFLKAERVEKVALVDVNMTGMTRSALNGSGVECIVRAGGELTVEQGTFESCTVQGANGGGLWARIESGGVVRVGNTTGRATAFRQCRSVDTSGAGGLGGAVALSLGMGAGGGSFVLQTMTFDGCSATKGGNQVFVEASTLSTVMNRNSFGFEFETSVGSVDLTDLMGYEDGYSDLGIPLVVYFRNFTGPAFVSGSGADYVMCGYSDFPCLSILHAMTTRYSGKTATIRLQSDFTLKDALVLKQSAVALDVGTSGTEVRVVNGGGGVSRGLIETGVDATCTGIVFTHPTSLTGREALMFCNGGHLVLNTCGAKMTGSEGLKCSFSLILCTAGKVTANALKITGTPYGGVAMILVDGDTAELHLTGMTLSGLTSQSDEGLVVVRSGAVVEMISATVSVCEMEQGPLIVLNSVKTALMQSVVTDGVKREVGYGGVAAVSVRDDDSMVFEKCGFGGSNIVSEEARGGTLYATVAEGGKLWFNGNRVNGSTLSQQKGLGGGLYLSFGGTADYSLQKIDFEANTAQKGNNVYLACSVPRNMINPLLFDGSVETTMDDNDLWVVDETKNPPFDETLRKYLFPSDKETMFVDTTQGVNTSTCGTETFPCATMDNGFSKLNEIQTTIHVVESVAMNGEVNRGETSLAVRGRTQGSEISVGAAGVLRIENGNGWTTLTVNRIVFVLTSESTTKVLISVGAGRMTLKDSTIRPTQEWGEVDVWIVKCTGGWAGLDGVTAKKVQFSSGGGLVKAQTSEVSIQGCHVEGVRVMGEEALIVMEPGGVAEMGDTVVTDCTSTSGNVVAVQDGGSVEISGGTNLTQCKSTKKNGGGIMGNIGNSGSITVRNGRVFECAVNEESGFGGAIYLSVSTEATASYLLSGVTFGSNKAKYGKDIFISCIDLNSTVIESRLTSLSKVDSDATALDVSGTDTTHFTNGVHDLFLFLNERSSAETWVSATGFDVRGCGSEKYACSTVWMGVNHADRASTAITLVLNGSLDVRDELDLSKFSVRCGVPNADATLAVSDTLSPGVSRVALSFTGSLSVENTVLVLPVSFTTNQEVVIGTPSDSGDVTLVKCTFVTQKGYQMDYQLISVGRGVVAMEECKMQDGRYSDAAIVCGGMKLTNCTAEAVVGKESKEGGLARVIVGTAGVLHVNSCKLEQCACNQQEGRGGALYVETNASVESDAVVLNNVTFNGNKAWKGANVYVVCNNLNDTIVAASWAFEYSHREEGGASLYAGSDANHKDTDLLRFLEEYHSSTVHAADTGFDVKRCGSEADPCKTLWKAIQQVRRETEDEEAAVVIKEGTDVSDAYDLSNYAVMSIGAMSESSERGALRFVSPNSGGNAHLENSKRLRLVLITLSAPASFTNEERALVVSECGELLVERCLMECSGLMETAGEFSFVVAKSGTVMCNGTEVSRLYVRLSVYRIGSVCNVTLTGGDIRSVEIEDGAVIAVDTQMSVAVSTTNQLASMGTIHLSNTQLSSITRRSGEGSVIEHNGAWGMRLNVSSCAMDVCQASASERGGAVLFGLGDGGRFTMQHTRFVQCGCSTTKGRGGGVYVISKGSGELLLLFSNMTFDSNAALRGKDIYIECGNIRKQINETLFRMDLREGAYSRVNAIYGRDQNEIDVDLIELITVYQSESVIVSGSEDTGGNNTRQCGTNKLPCKTIGYGLTHVVTGDDARLRVDTVGVVESEIDIADVSVLSRTQLAADIVFALASPATRGEIISTFTAVRMSQLRFDIASGLGTGYDTMLRVVSGELMVTECGVAGSGSSEALDIETVVSIGPGTCRLDRCQFTSLCVDTVLVVETDGLSGARVNRKVGIDSLTSGQRESDDTSVETRLFVVSSVFQRTKSARGIGRVLSASGVVDEIVLQICTVTVDAVDPTSVGVLASLVGCSNVCVEFSTLSGTKTPSRSKNDEHLCEWTGSLLHLESTSARLNDVTFGNASGGGLSVAAGEVTIEECRFENNTAGDKAYPSIRRNIQCSRDAHVNIKSLKAGDGAYPSESLWMWSQKCEVEGSVTERGTLMFVPHITTAKWEKNEEDDELYSAMIVTLTGTLFIPCNLSIEIISSKEPGQTTLETSKELTPNECAGEDLITVRVARTLVKDIDERDEIAVHLIGEDRGQKIGFDKYVLRNRTEKKNDGDVLAAGSHAQGWMMYVMISSIVLFGVLFVVFVVYVMSVRRGKRKAGERLKESVKEGEDSKLQSKELEMDTMELNAGSKDETDIVGRRRVWKRGMVESDSQQSLLTNVSTQDLYGIINGTHEKTDEDSSRVVCPSSTSTLSSEMDKMDPSTSSLVNLVEALCCESPYERVIVDLRDSLFMMVHTHDVPVDYAMTTRQERGQAGTQIMFWVCHLIHHSWNEGRYYEVFGYLSPHVILFGEEGRICVCVHGEYSDDDSSESSEDDNDDDDDDDDDDDESGDEGSERSDLKSRSRHERRGSRRHSKRKKDGTRSRNSERKSETNALTDTLHREAVRWMAPETIISPQIRVAERGVVFAVGMILWEMLFELVPFGDFDREVAREKIENGERPSGKLGDEPLEALVGNCLQQRMQDRPNMEGLRRELLGLFPEGTARLTMADAILFETIVSSSMEEGSESTTKAGTIVNGAAPANGDAAVADAGGDS